jgi:hypothetical protein
MPETLQSVFRKTKPNYATRQWVVNSGAICVGWRTRRCATSVRCECCAGNPRGATGSIAAGSTRNRSGLSGTDRGCAGHLGKS